MRIGAGVLTALTVYAATLYVGFLRTPYWAVPPVPGKSASLHLVKLLAKFRNRLKGSAAPGIWEDVFYSIAFHLRAGETLQQAVRGVAEEGSGGPYELLRGATRAYEGGAPILQALRSGSEGSFESRRLVEAVEIGLVAGSDLPSLLCHTAENLTRKRAMHRAAKAKMTESRLTAFLLSAMPWLIGAITYWHDPSLLMQALSTPLGLSVLWGSIGLWVLGNGAIFLTLSSINMSNLK